MTDDEKQGIVWNGAVAAYNNDESTVVNVYRVMDEYLDSGMDKGLDDWMRDNYPQLLPVYSIETPLRTAKK